MMTGLTAGTYKALQTDAGVFLRGFDWSSYSTKSTLATAVYAAIGTDSCIGATRGGGSFQATPSNHTVEVDGARYGFVGDTRTDSWDIKLTGTMVEITGKNFAAALGSADVATSGSKTTVTLRTNLKDTDYIENLCWVGDTAEGLMLIGLKNAINSNGVNFTFTDKGEGTIPFEFSAKQSDVSDYTTAPVEIIFFQDT